MSICVNGAAGDSTTPYDRAIAALHGGDPSWTRDVTLGKRVGLYRIQGDLGRGNFSKVKLAVHHLVKETVAIKTVDKLRLDAKTSRMLNREISIMQELCHPNIVQLFEVIETLDRVHLIMEYASGGELCALININGKMTEQRSRMVFSQLLSAVHYLHSRQVIHRDIKSENVFLVSCDDVTTMTADNGNNGRWPLIKVGDFGFSTTVLTADDRLRTFCGSPPYAAPELFEDESYVGPAVDVWALGVLLFYIVTGHMPFRANTVAELKRLIVNGCYEMPSHVSVDCARLVRAILRHNPQQRYTLQRVMESPWMTTDVDRRPSCTYKIFPSGMYHPWPTRPADIRTKRELEVRSQLQQLGITDRMIDDQSRCCNHPIIGMFRILMHALQDTALATTAMVPILMNNTETRNRLDNRSGVTKASTSGIEKKARQMKKSNTCVIL